MPFEVKVSDYCPNHRSSRCLRNRAKFRLNQHCHRQCRQTDFLHQTKLKLDTFFKAH